MRYSVMCTEYNWSRNYITVVSNKCKLQTAEIAVTPMLTHFSHCILWNLAPRRWKNGSFFLVPSTPNLNVQVLYLSSMLVILSACLQNRLFELSCMQINIIYLICKAVKCTHAYLVTVHTQHIVLMPVSFIFVVLMHQY